MGILNYTSLMNAKQPSAPSAGRPTALTGHAGYLAVALGHHARKLFEDAIAPLDLKPMHYDFMATLAECGDVSQRQLAVKLGFDPARIVALTDALAERDLVARTVDASDRRRNLVTLTRKGKTLTRRVARIAQEVEAELLSDLSAEEREQLRILMRRALNLT